MACFDRFRYVVALLICASTLNIMLGRSNLSVVVSFLSKHPLSNSSSPHDICPAPLANHSISASIDSSSPALFGDGLYTFNVPFNQSAKFDWDEKTQGHILSSFFVAYIIVHIPCGLLTQRFGPKLMISIGLIVTGLMNLVAPLLVSQLWALIGSRVVMGMAQPAIYCGSMSLTVHWFPPSERGTVFGLTGLGTCLGAIIATALSGHLCQHFHWQWAFYLPGGVITVFGLLYACLMSNHPKDHFMVSPHELRHIEKHKGGASLNGFVQSTNATGRSAPPFPWIAVLTSPAVWATICARLFQALAVSFISSKAISYLEKVLQVNVDLAGYCVSAIFAISALSGLAAGLLADTALRRGVHKTTIRKLFQSIASFSTAIGFLLLPSSNCDSVLFMVIILLSSIASGFNTGGESSIPADLTTEHTAMLFSLINMISMVVFISPTVIGALLDANKNQLKHTWWNVFYFIGASNVLGGLVFVFFASAELQSWQAQARTPKQYPQTDNKNAKV